jgi:DNA-binding CsgD family transcriptional regulator
MSFIRNFNAVPDTDPIALSPREWEVLESIENGLTDVEIADRLLISPNAANKDVKQAFRKLRIRFAS